MRDGIAFQVHVHRAGGHRRHSVVVKPAARRIELFFSIIVGATVPFAGEAGHIAQLLHPLGQPPFPLPDAGL